MEPMFFWESTNPAPRVIAKLAVHHGTTTIFLNQAFASWTFMEVNITSDCFHQLLILLTTFAFMPRLLTFEACIFVTEYTI
jgi:hypothetical protein